MIPIKGYATFDPLKHCLVGQTFSSDFFKHIIKEPKISGPLQRIADETEEDYLKLEKILKVVNFKWKKAKGINVQQLIKKTEKQTNRQTDIRSLE